MKTFHKGELLKPCQDQITLWQELEDDYLLAQLPLSDILVYLGDQVEDEIRVYSQWCELSGWVSARLVSKV